METVLLVLDSEEMQRALSEALRERYNVRLCHSSQVRNEILAHRPGALVLDLFLSGTDGFSVLGNIRDCLPPVVLMLTPLISTYIAQTAADLGVGFLVRFPCTASTITTHLNDMIQRSASTMALPGSSIQSHLQRLGIPMKLDGYQQLCIALPLFAKDPNQSLTKELYPAVARHFGCSPQAVEHSIRMAIRAAWKHRNPEVWEEYFPGCVKCPTNKEFLSALAIFLQ